MDAIFFVTLFGVAFQVSNGLGSCYQCAAEELYGNWHMTGFPNRPGKSVFVQAERCKTPTGLTGQSSVVRNCVSSCVTLSIQKTSITTGIMQELFVRGCADILLGFDPKMPADFCQAGTIKRLDSQNEPVQTHAWLSFCTDSSGSGGQCNSATAQPDTCASANGATKGCVECSSYNADCDGPGVCQGQYCYKSSGNLGKSKIVSKGCSPFNLYSSAATNICKTVRTSQFVPTLTERLQRSINGTDHVRQKRGVTIPYEGIQCYCNDKEHCNGAGSLVAKVISLVTILIPMVVLKQ